MKPKKIPMRTCVITREKYPKSELIRIVKTPEGLVEIDRTGKKNGRGAYMKLDEQTIIKAEKSKKLGSSLGFDVPEEIYEELKKLL